MSILFPIRVQSLLKVFFNRFSTVPRVLIYSIDLFIVLVSIVFAYYLRFNFNDPLIFTPYFYESVITVVFIRAVIYFTLTIYSGIVRFTSSDDVERIIFIIFLSSVIIFGVSSVYRIVYQSALIPLSVIIIDFLLVSILTITYRLFVKSVYLSLMTATDQKSTVIIFGDMDFCRIVKNILEKDPKAGFEVKAFVTAEPNLPGSQLDGIRFFHVSKLEGLLKRDLVNSVLFSETSTDIETKNYLTETCLRFKTQPILVPDIHQLFSGELTYSQFREVKVEDLLDRKPIEFDKHGIIDEIEGKVILITGAAGSIGSEIVRQLTTFKPKLLVLLDHAETPLFEISQQLRMDLKFVAFEKVLCCVTNKEKVEKIFETYKPDIVYHAAAYKHVPMMEKYPCEAIRVNVLGTKTISDNSLKHGVRKFVMISTDKAVNPTNVMGASKRIAELYCQILNEKHKTAFIITRFGNVIGSNGSVIPTFRDQIKAHEPITITHPEITRYFMSIPEACQLVLQAGVMGNSNEIFIFDMGKPVKIYDLACKMIRLSGYKVGEDVQIVFTGLRPGEKLYEELLTSKENTKETYHPRILIAHRQEIDFEAVNLMIEDLISLYKSSNDYEVVKKMKRLVPEYISNNSQFEAIDKELEAERLQTQKELL